MAGDTLFKDEIWWRDHQVWLDERGYKLRPRLTPGWVPSWLGKGKGVRRHKCEDYQYEMHPSVQDALRKDNNQRVILKKINTTEYPNEQGIATYFSSKELADIPENHCVPILEILHIPDEEHVILLAMPLLHHCLKPPLETVGEVVEFFRQVFEGIHFMHQHRIAHRDCHGPNILMNADAMYPSGFHAVKQDMLPNWKGKAKHFSRTERPPKYYLIDFGLSVRFDPDESAPRARVIRGGDRDYPPELLDRDVEYDPFPTDVFYLGNIIKHEFTEGSNYIHSTKKLGFEFLEGLAADMTNPDPLKRPTMDEVVSRYREIQQGLSSWKLRQRVVRSDEFFSKYNIQKYKALG